MRTARGAVVALALVVGMTGCGGDEPDAAQTQPPSTASAEDRATITALAFDVVTADDKDANRVCGSLLTEKLVRTVYQNQETCRESADSDPAARPTGALVTAIAVDGDTATAVVTDQGGLSDGATGQWRFVRAGASWRVDEWAVDYFRSILTRIIEGAAEVGAPSPFKNDQLRTCMIQRLHQQAEGAFLASVYKAFRSEERAERFLFGLMFACGKAEVSPGVTLLRTAFEDVLREALEVLPVTLQDCLLAKTRRTISESEVRAALKDEAKPSASDKVAQAADDCRGEISD